ncbi:MAG: hypothetical protein IPM54_11505 [Polyangiaceae bacterium]|nr:hypothetical protein [Polyangiaceae bacterium]
MKRERSAMKPDSDGRMDTKNASQRRWVRRGMSNDSAVVVAARRALSAPHRCQYVAAAIKTMAKTYTEREIKRSESGVVRARQPSRAQQKLMRRLNKGSASATIPRGFRG